MDFPINVEEIANVNTVPPLKEKKKRTKKAPQETEIEQIDTTTPAVEMQMPVEDTEYGAWWGLAGFTAGMFMGVCILKVLL